MTANCYNNEDFTQPERKFKVCLNNECITDVLLYECTSASWYGAGFKSGYSASCSSEVEGSGYNSSSKPLECEFKIGEFKMPTVMRKEIVCVALNVDDMSCFWYEMAVIE